MKLKHDIEQQLQIREAINDYVLDALDSIKIFLAVTGLIAFILMFFTTATRL